MTQRRTEVLMWIGLFAAPVAWVGSEWGMASCTIPEWALLLPAALLAGAGIAGSFLTYRAVKGTDNDDAPPAGRIWILSIAGMVLSPLLFMIILLTHVGALLLSSCHQG